MSYLRRENFDFKFCAHLQIHMAILPLAKISLKIKIYPVQAGFYYMPYLESGNLDFKFWA